MNKYIYILYMDIIYNNNTHVSGQFLEIQLTQDKPFVSLSGLDSNKKYALIMSDPDAVGGNHIHWIVTNIKGNNFDEGNEILEYYGPHPPIGSGLHNYIFLLYESDYDKKERMDPTKRQIELEDILNKLNIKGEPIYKTKFISKNPNGGKKKRKTKRRKNFRKKTKRRKY